jgi:hypothetical protein
MAATTPSRTRSSFQGESSSDTTWKDLVMPRGGVNRITLKFCKNWAADQGLDDPAVVIGWPGGVQVTLTLRSDQPTRKDRV